MEQRLYLLDIGRRVICKTLKFLTCRRMQKIRWDMYVKKRDGVGKDRSKKIIKMY